MEFSKDLIYDDMRNNSAWNYRFFIASNLSDNFKDEEFLEKEIK